MKSRDKVVANAMAYVLNASAFDKFVDKHAKRGEFDRKNPNKVNILKTPVKVGTWQGHKVIADYANDKIFCDGKWIYGLPWRYDPKNPYPSNWAELVVKEVNGFYKNSTTCNNLACNADYTGKTVTKNSNSVSCRRSTNSKVKWTSTPKFSKIRDEIHAKMPGMAELCKVAGWKAYFRTDVSSSSNLNYLYVKIPTNSYSKAMSFEQPAIQFLKQQAATIFSKIKQAGFSVRPGKTWFRTSPNDSSDAEAFYEFTVADVDEESVSCNRVTEADVKEDPKDPYGHVYLRGKRMTLADAAIVDTLETPPSELKSKRPNIFAVFAKRSDYKKMWAKELSAMGLNSDIACNSEISAEKESAAKKVLAKHGWIGGRGYGVPSDPAIAEACKEATKVTGITDPMKDPNGNRWFEAKNKAYDKQKKIIVDELNALGGIYAFAVSTPRVKYQGK